MPTSSFLRLLFSSGCWSGLLSAAALVWASRREGDGPATGLNGPSHWFYGEPAVHVQTVSVRHTLVGLLTHQASSFFWSVFFTALHRAERRAGPAAMARQAATITMAAAVVDFAVVPKRLAPGFERRLGVGSLTGVYLAFGSGLAIAALLAARRRGRGPDEQASRLPVPRAGISGSNEVSHEQPQPLPRSGRPTRYEARHSSCRRSGQPGRHGRDT